MIIIMRDTKPEIIIVTGEINSGKTTLLEKLVKEEKTKGLTPTGIIARGIFDGKIKIGFDVIDLSSGISMPLARTDRPFDNGFVIGKYYFSGDAFKFAQDALLNFRPHGVVFLDEAGPLELEGRGHADCLRILIDSNIIRLYVSVRSECLKEFIEKFAKINPVKIIQVNS
jgi:nucleoside-triphosphatase THEP1